MYIISKFHDYYDCMMKQGLDKTIIYHRNEETITPLPHNLGIYHYYQDFIERTVNGSFYLSDVTINTGLLGFCGKKYVVMICQYKEMTLASCIYSRWLDKLKHAKLENYPKNIYQFMEQSLAKKSKHYFYSNYCGLAINEKNMLATFNNHQAIKIRDELFIELNCPVFFVYQDYNLNTAILIKNPPLKPFDFQCVLSPEIAFQEIAYYIGNFLTQRDNPSQITDNKILCAAKGFDTKTSFRKPPTKP